jgi:hypothetical protein
VNPARLRGALSLVAGVVVLTILLAMPGPQRGADRAAATAPAGPPTLASVWPQAHAFPIAATFPDGSAFYPLAVVDPGNVIGLAGSPDGRRSDLVVAGPTGAPRLLDPVIVDSGERVGPVTFDATEYFWMRAVLDEDGRSHFSLWAAERSGGTPHQVSDDVGQPVANNSRYDLQIVADRLYWITNDDSGGYQLRSIGVAGGTVTLRQLPGQWAMLAWPWMTTAPGSTQPPALWNLTTGEHRAVAAPTGRIVFCSVQWCRTVGDNVLNATDTQLMRPDGTDVQMIGGRDTIAIGDDVAVLDRFEPLTITQNDTGSVTVYTVLLYDIKQRRTVRIEASATDAYSLGSFLWWSTGDNETTAWYGLDLRTLH